MEPQSPDQPTTPRRGVPVERRSTLERKRRLRPWPCALILIAVMAGALLQSRAVSAAATTLYVATNGTDTNNSCQSAANPCRTIGYAISVASAGDSVSVASGTYPEHITIGLNLTLTGSGASTTIIDGTTNGTVVTVNGGVTVSISAVTIQNGSVPANCPTSSPCVVGGGGILNNGNLALGASVVRGNSVTGCMSSYCGLASGGGVYNSGGSLSITNSTVSGNTVPKNGGGGGIYNSAGSLSVVASTIEGNLSPQGDGGGIYNGGSSLVSSSTITDNSANYGGALPTVLAHLQ